MSLAILIFKESEYTKWITYEPKGSIHLIMSHRKSGMTYGARLWSHQTSINIALLAERGNMCRNLSLYECERSSCSLGFL